MKTTKTDRFYVNTPTLESYEKVVRKMLDEGRVWADGYKGIYSKGWYEYKELSSVAFNYAYENEITTSDCDFYKEEGLKLIPYQEFLGEEEFVFVTGDISKENSKLGILVKSKSDIKNGKWESLGIPLEDFINDLLQKQREELLKEVGKMVYDVVREGQEYWDIDPLSKRFAREVAREVAKLTISTLQSDKLQIKKEK